MPSVRSNLFCLFGLCIRILWLRPLEATSLNLKCHCYDSLHPPFLLCPMTLLSSQLWENGWVKGEEGGWFHHLHETVADKQENSRLIFSTFLSSHGEETRLPFLSSWDLLIPLCATWFPITDITDAWDAQLRRRLTALATSAQSHLVHGLRWGSTGHRKPLTSWWPGNREKE